MKKRTGIEEQIAALPLRIADTGAVETLLVTSRGTGRWVLPKGNLMKGRAPAEAAAIEAQEEAGVIGCIVETPYRSFEYWKRRNVGFHLCHVDVFLLIVTREDAAWKEQDERQRAWVPFARAGRMVMEPGLQSIFWALAIDDAIPKLVHAMDEGVGKRRWAELVGDLSSVG